MRNAFDEQLDRLNIELVEMGALIEQAIANAAAAAINHEKKLAAEAIRIDGEVDKKEKDIENICLKLLLKQQPVARDLRQISAALKMITDMERIGDQAADISEIVMVGNISSAVSKAEHIEKMALSTIQMVNGCVDAFVKKDLSLAYEVIKSDDRVDDLFDAVCDDLVRLIKSGTDDSMAVIDILMIAKYFERIGDHATNIAEWVVFSITGEHKVDLE